MVTLGEYPSCTACWVSEKAPEISACEATTAAAVAMHDHRVECPRRVPAHRRVVQCVGMLQQQRRLPEVVEQQCGQRHGEPGEADRAAAEVTHVGVQRLAARHHQHHRSEDEEAGEAVVAEEAHRMDRVHGRKDGRIRGKPAHPEQRNAHEPDHHDRPEDVTHARGAASAAPGTAAAGSPPTGTGPTLSKMLVATVRPSTAPSTEMAGVMMPSPYSSAAPNRPAPMRITRAAWCSPFHVAGPGPAAPGCRPRHGCRPAART